MSDPVLIVVSDPRSGVVTQLVPQPSVVVVTANQLGPQGPTGPQGPPGPSGSGSVITDATLTGNGALATPLSVVYGSTAGTAAQGNDSRLGDSRTPTGSASGDLSGTYPAPSVVNIHFGSDAQGDLAYRNASVWTRLAAGASGQWLQTGGAGADPSWQTISTTTLGAVPTSRQVIAGTGLTGGGALSADVTLTVSFGATGATACVGNDSRLSDARTPTGSAGGDLAGTYPNPTVGNLHLGSDAQGDIAYRGASVWTRLAAGTSGQYLKTQGASANPTWADVTTTTLGAVPTSRTLTGTSPIAIAGDNSAHDLSADRTISFAIASQAQGDVIYYNGSAWTRLGAGTAGQYLRTAGAGANPTWVNPGVSIIGFGASAGPASTTTAAWFNPFNSSTAAASSATNAPIGLRFYMPAAGTIDQFRVACTTGNGVASGVDYTVCVNDSASSITCHLAQSATTGSDLSHTASVNAGDYVTVKQVNGGASGSGGSPITITMRFTAST